MSHALDDLKQKMRKAPYLTPEEEIELARRYRRGDQVAGHKLVQAHMRQAFKTAKQFSGYNVPLEELMSQGAEGLMQALAKYDPERGVRFATYASWWIRAAVSEHVLNVSSAVRFGASTNQKKLFFHLPRLRAEFGDAEGNLSADAVTKIAAQLSVPESEVERMMGRLSGPDVSIDSTIDDSNVRMVDVIPDQSASPEEALADRQLREQNSRLLQDALNQLDPRSRRILIARRLTQPAVTLRDLGARENISRERVRQIEVQAMARLRKAMRTHPAAPDMV